MKTLSLLTLFMVFSGGLCASVSAQNQAQTSDLWQMSSAEKGRWFQKLQSVAPVAEWTITNKSNDFIIEHNTPVPFAAAVYNNMVPNNPRSKSKYRFEQELRITLRFFRLWTEEEWLQRENQNRVARDANERLMERFQIFRAFAAFYISGEDAAQRLSQYQNEAQKLVAYHLPQLYSSEHSILVSYSWKKGSIDETKPEGVKCRQTLEDIHALFKGHQRRTTYIAGAPLEENSPRVDVYWLGLYEETANRPLYPVKVSIRDFPKHAL